MNMDVNTENPFVQALIVSTTMAVFMIGVAFGLMSMTTNEDFSVSIPIMLLVFAVIFIAGSVYFESRGADYMGSLVGGAIISMVATFSATAFYSGVMFAIGVMGGDIETTVGFDQVISALAICMVASMLLIRILQHKLSNAF
ncbi:MAG: hypothetical protein PWQ75_1226 [Methanolobus sp.]|jgi:hypothetical protein|nr:hypothetical protein [Methanolobus sp.]